MHFKWVAVLFKARGKIAPRIWNFSALEVDIGKIIRANAGSYFCFSPIWVSIKFLFILRYFVLHFKTFLILRPDQEQHDIQQLKTIYLLKEINPSWNYSQLIFGLSIIVECHILLNQNTTKIWWGYQFNSRFIDL